LRASIPVKEGSWIGESMYSWTIYFYKFIGPIGVTVRVSWHDNADDSSAPSPGYDNIIRLSSHDLLTSRVTDITWCPGSYLQASSVLHCVAHGHRRQLFPVNCIGPKSGIYSASLNIMKLVRRSVISRLLRLVQQVWLVYTPPWPQLLYQTSRVGVLNNHRPAARLSGLILPLKSSCCIQIDL